MLADWQLPPGVDRGLWDYAHDDVLARGYDGRLADSPLVHIDQSYAAEIFDQPGRLGMANIGSPNTGGCQFFVTAVPYPSLNGGYTVFGQVVEGQDIVNKIEETLEYPGQIKVMVIREKRVVDYAK